MGLPGKLILSRRKGLWEVLFCWKQSPRIDFPGRPIFIQFVPADAAVAVDAPLPHVHRDGERELERHRREEHLDADEKVLVAGCDRAGRECLDLLAVLLVVDGDDVPQALHHGQDHALPEGEEDDGLDGEELENGVERLQEVPCGEVEQEQSVQRQRDGRVVDQGDVHVALGRVPVAVLVEVVALQPDDDEGHDGLDDTELQRGLLAEPQEADVVGMSGEAAGAVDPGGLDGLAADLGHDVALAPQVLVAERQEVVDHEGCRGKEKEY